MQLEQVHAEGTGRSVLEEESICRWHAMEGSDEADGGRGRGKGQVEKMDGGRSGVNKWDGSCRLGSARLSTMTAWHPAIVRR